MEAKSQSKTSCVAHLIVILFIPFLFVIGLILGYLGMVPLKVEVHTLVIVAFIFLVFLLFAKHNANYAICKMRGGFGKMEEALQEVLEANALTIMGKRKSTLSIQSFFEEYYKDIRNDNFAKVAPSIFPMLGILGTFVAIALSMPDFTITDTTALDHEISLLLSGIGTAFYASIYGIMLSLIWTYFEKRGLSKVDKNIHDLERLYDAQIWKQSELIKHQHMQSELKDQAIVQTLKETFNMDFIHQLNDQYLSNFMTIMNETTKSYTELTKQMQEASSQLRETLTKIYGSQESLSALMTMRDNIEGFSENAKRLEATMQRFDHTVDHTFEQIDSEIGEVVKKLGAFAGIISEQNQMLLDTMIKMREEMK